MSPWNIYLVHMFIQYHRVLSFFSHRLQCLNSAEHSQIFSWVIIPGSYFSFTFEFRMKTLEEMKVLNFIKFHFSAGMKLFSLFILLFKPYIFGFGISWLFFFCRFRIQCVWIIDVYTVFLSNWLFSPNPDYVENSNSTTRFF